jgi:hypothetical protein
LSKIDITANDLLNSDSGGEDDKASIGSIERQIQELEN